MDFKDISDDKRAFIEQSQKALSESVIDVEKSIYQLFIKKLSELDIENGNIVSSPSNFKLVRELSNLGNQLSDLKKGLIIKIIEAFTKIFMLNKKYFETFKTTTEAVNKEVLTQLYERFGYDENGIVKQGFFDDLVQSDEEIAKLKSEALRAVASNIDFKSFKKAIGRKVITNKNVSGVVKRAWSTIIDDIYSNYDRGVASAYSSKLGLNYAVFQGGIMQTTRPFCRQRNNKVFTREEIKSWELLEFEGKPVSYNPFIDLGGYNCRHTLDWIDEETYNILKDNLV